MPDGRVRLRLRVGHWVEMRAWVLGWGDACEVVAPRELRAWVAATVVAMAQIYQRAADPIGAMITGSTSPITFVRARQSRQRRERRTG